jgi:phosphoheptose isomerase
MSDTPGVPGDAVTPLDPEVSLVWSSLRRTRDALERVPARQTTIFAQMIADTLGRGGRVYALGCGGSAADAQHLAAELVGRFSDRSVERGPLPVVSLSSDTTVITALANDFGFERVYEYQVEALARPDDLVVAISTSGSSPSVSRAIHAARRVGARSALMTGGRPLQPELVRACDYVLAVEGLIDSASIQECHRAIIHAACSLVESRTAVRP